MKSLIFSKGLLGVAAITFSYGVYRIFRGVEWIFSMFSLQKQSFVRILKNRSYNVMMQVKIKVLLNLLIFYKLFQKMNKELSYI